MELETQQGISKLNESSDNEIGFQFHLSGISLARIYIYIVSCPSPRPKHQLDVLGACFDCVELGWPFYMVGGGRGNPFGRRMAKNKKNVKESLNCVFSSEKWELRYGWVGRERDVKRSGEKENEKR